MISRSCNPGIQEGSGSGQNVGMSHVLTTNAGTWGRRSQSLQKIMSNRSKWQACPPRPARKRQAREQGSLRLEGLQSLRGHPGTRFGTGSTPCTACLRWHPCCRPWQGTAGARQRSRARPARSGLHRAFFWFWVTKITQNRLIGDRH